MKRRDSTTTQEAQRVSQQVTDITLLMNATFKLDPEKLARIRPNPTTTNYATEKYLAAVKALQELVYPPDAWGLVEAVFRAIGEQIVQDETDNA